MYKKINYFADFIDFRMYKIYARCIEFEFFW